MVTRTCSGPLAFDLASRAHALDWVVALHDNPAAMRRLAASAHPLVRRSVARARRLPADVVERCCCGCGGGGPAVSPTPAAPQPPRFPRAGLLRFADDPDPRMRRLALEDPRSTAKTVDRSARDADPQVRLRAAIDPRLSPTVVQHLLDDPADCVRAAAVRHPRLPAPTLVRLLRDPDTTRDAAHNPALPAPVASRMPQWLRAADGRTDALGRPTG